MQISTTLGAVHTILISSLKPRTLVSWAAIMQRRRQIHKDKRGRRRAGGAGLALVVALAAAAHAAVTRIEVAGRTPLAGGMAFGAAGAYEKITGTLTYAVDPENPANDRIVDLALAPRDAAGRVTFAADFVLIKPVDRSRGNGRLVYGVNNRGNLVMLHTFNDAPWNNAPVSAADMGNGFLLRRGYTLLWSAWNWDVVAGTGRLQIDLPIAGDGGRPITGPVAAEMTAEWPTDTLPVAWGGSLGYPPADPAEPGATLSVRATPQGRRRVLPRERWRFLAAAPVRVRLDGGFEPGLVYELVYTARDPRVVGLGLAAIRDALSFFRFAGAPNPLAGDDGKGRPQAVLIYGFSQSARVIQHMLLEGLHVDEAGRGVFDAAFVHGPGAGKGSFNHRFAQTTRHPSHWEDHLYPADVFPFTAAVGRDPETGAEAGLMDRARALGVVPHRLYLSAATEYWTRAASLLHTDAAAARDVEPDARARLYEVAGAAHGVGFRSGRGGFINCPNPLDYRPLARALLVALDRWATQGRAPPDSAFPRIADGALGSVAAYRATFPAIGGLGLPTGNLRPPRLDHGPRFAAAGIADRQPARPGAPYATLVPLPDRDGLDRGGVRLPEVAVPVGTYLGWNLRRDGPDRLGRWQGAFLPLAASAAARRAGGDPRPSLAERYGSEPEFLERTRAAAAALLRRRLLLAEDVPGIIARAGRAYRALAAAPSGTGCGYLEAWRTP